MNHIARLSHVFLLAVMICRQPALAESTGPDPGVNLLPPVPGDGVVFVPLVGEAGVPYVLEGSTNLHTWIPLATNVATSITRMFTNPIVSTNLLYRAGRMPLPLVSAAVATDGNIDIQGWNLQSDSFDSTDTNYSDNGLYLWALPEKQKDAGHIFSNSHLTNSAGTGDVRIKGMVRTGPAGFAYVGTNGSIGSKAWVEGDHLGVQEGYLRNDMNTYWPWDRLPATTWFALPTSGAMGTNINGVDYRHHVTFDGNYLGSMLQGSLYVAAHARILLRGELQLTGAVDQIRIAPGASLELYVEGQNVTIGAGGIHNASGLPEHLILYCLRLTDSVAVTASTPYVGMLYAPESDIEWGAPGGAVYHCVGAVVGRSMSLNGHAFFHFDENLVRLPNLTR